MANITIPIDSKVITGMKTMSLTPCSDFGNFSKALPHPNTKSAAK